MEPSKRMSSDEYIKGIIAQAEAKVEEKRFLLQAYGDFMDVNYKKVDPILDAKWEHNAMFVLHNRFMVKADSLSAQMPAIKERIDELTNIMKLIAQLVDLSLLPDDVRKSVEEWAEHYKKYLNKKSVENWAKKAS